VIVCKNRHEISGTEDPDINPYSYIYLIFDKSAQNIRWRKNSLFYKCYWETWISAYKKWK
jgi:hypothetical protein